jgi:subtilisin family serine protease
MMKDCNLLFALAFAIAVQCAWSQDTPEINCTKLWKRAAQKESLPGEYIIGFNRDDSKWDGGWPTRDEMLEQAQTWFDAVPTFMTNYSYSDVDDSEIERFRNGTHWREYFDDEPDDDLKEGRRSSRAIKAVVTLALHAYTFKLNMTDEPKTTICGFEIPTLLIDMMKSKHVGFVEEEQLFRNSSDVSIQPGGVTIQSQPDWGLDRIDQKESNLDDKYAYTYNGTNTIVYIVDTGIQTTHEDFGGRASCGIDLTTLFALGDCQDENGHGTHVAGTVGGTSFGVAKAAELVAVRVLGKDGSGSTSDIVSGINWVIEQRNKASNDGKGMVINMSLGGGLSTSLNRATNNAVDAGIFVVVAAGNENQDACDVSPASSSEALTVGSTDDKDVRSSFSNWGTCVEIFGPGSSIRSDYIGSNTATAVLSGTSMVRIFPFHFKQLLC